jgi:hypothetical protein
VFVGPTAEALVDGVPYSMPPDAANVPGTAFVYVDTIRIVAGRHEATHARRRPGDPPATLPEHRAQKLAAVHEGRARTYEMRQQVLNLGEDALRLLTALVHRSPQAAHAKVERLHALLDEYGEDAMREALAHAVSADDLTVRAVQDVLEARGAAHAAHGERQLPIAATRAASQARSRVAVGDERSELALEGAEKPRTAGQRAARGKSSRTVKRAGRTKRGRSSR